ncbi:hypothetical protein C7974DRAFT_394550 [Boeremia exigua]|uniref:uncharacterized protein n=1 Tax=Boeremia exigua TaxID=749465 RepID=UPI001E8DDED4|nr:uncharacterized protein C7974DRAFT_394550 [Boeremia exigua]KAH6629467.1 hypothetical protein C7974DRAFT_394550 [Boeremia exigua]
MVPNLSATPTPALLTDQFGLLVHNETKYFRTIHTSLHDTREYDNLIGGVTLIVLASLIVLFKLYHLITYNKPLWKIHILWCKYVRPKLSLQHLSLGINTAKLRNGLFSILKRNDIDDNVEAGQFDSQDTTLQGSSSGGSATSIETQSTRSRGSIEGQLHAPEPIPDFDDGGAQHEVGQVWIPLHPPQHGKSAV